MLFLSYPHNKIIAKLTNIKETTLELKELYKYLIVEKARKSIRNLKEISFIYFKILVNFTHPSSASVR
jgi:hypothetical protein